MAQPPAYNRTKDFGADYPDQTDNQAINTELDAVASSISGIRTNLALIQRDDGGLANGIVTKDSLADSLKDDLYNEFSGNINDSVLAAQQAAVEATNAADAANADASTAVAARNDAQTAATSAQASAAAASASQTAAAGSATAAANSASSASSSALAASASAGTASAGATTATNAANSATTSASTATSAATTATTAKNDAQTAATSASGSATAAAGSATLAQHYADLAASQAGLRTFTTIPSTNQGVPVCVEPHGILYWDAAAGRYISAECGETRYFSRTTPPAGFIAEDNALLNIADFPALFARIGTMYGGNGTTNFRAPEGRGEFLRGADMGRGIDTGRAVGSAQSATSILAAPGASTTGNPVLLSPVDADSTAGGGSPALAMSSGGGTAVSRFTTRPRNVARLACVKYQ